jgi:transposase
MSKDYVAGEERDQSILFPETLDEYISEENPVRFIDAFVGSLDLDKLGFDHAKLDGGAGRPPYDPSDLLKLYVYGYLNQIRSSRKLEKACVSNLEVMWLLKKLAPDFKTIADFRKDNIDCIKPVFKEFVYLCRGLDLFGAELVSIDGSKFRAVNSKERNFNKKKLLDRLKRVNESIERYLKEIEENDGNEPEGSKKRTTTDLEEKLKKLEEKKKEYEALMTRMEENGESEISLTDPESRLMRSNGKLEVCYNTQTAVDSKNKLIAEYDVVNGSADQNQLSPMAKSAKEILGVERICATADKGYYSFDQIKECIDNGITPYIPEPLSSASGNVKKNGMPTPEFYDSKFIYDGTTSDAAYICPTGKRLEFFYWSNNYDGKGRRYALYRTDACFACPYYMTKCTRNKRGRLIRRWEHEDILDEMRARTKSPEGRRKVEMRKELSEHPFGTMKRAFNQGYLLLKGLRKVRGEVGFTMLAYNMRRAINILGPKALMTSLR